MVRGARGILELICFIIDSPCDRLTSIAMMEIKVEDDCSGYTIFAMSISNGNMNVVDHAESARHFFCAMMTRWTNADMDSIVSICQHPIDPIVNGAYTS